MTRSLLVPTLAVLVLGAASWASDSFTFDRSGKIWVEGTASVRDWECQVGQFAGVLDADVEGTHLTSLGVATVKIPVQGIDCGNGTMNRRLRDALGQTPIRYALTSATLSAPEADGWTPIRTTGRLTISGTMGPAQMTVKGKALDDGHFRFTGQHALLMTDFGIDPPTALLGTLKTRDEVTVYFDITVSPLGSN
jgi:polyisoprenoid-binding protein YceI